MRCVDGDTKYLDCIFSLHLFSKDVRSFAFKISIERGLLFAVFLLSVGLISSFLPPLMELGLADPC